MISRNTRGRNHRWSAHIWLGACLGAASLLVACGPTDPYQLGPPPEQWSDEDSTFVTSLRLTRPELSDREAARWIVAGRAACQALREGYDDHMVADRAGDIVDEDFTRVDIRTSANSYCTEYIWTVGSFFEAP
jgi:hypothetical protein